MSELRIIRAEGNPVQRGQRIGRELRDLMNESIDFYGRYMSRRGVSTQQLQELLTPYLVSAESAFPQFMATLNGMSAGATVPFLELFAVNAFEELEPLLESPEGELLFLQKKEGYTQRPAPAPDRCSSISVRTPDGGTLLAHNEHWLAGDADNVAVVVDHPADGRVAVASPTVVCCLPAVGVNGHGAAQGIGSLTASDDGIGVPRVLVSRSSLEARDRRDAIARGAMPGRAGGYGHVFAFRDGDCFTLETTGREHRLLEGAAPHTNHYRSDLAELAPEPSEGSRARLHRLLELVEEEPPSCAEDLMTIMRDHGSAPQSICLHPDPTEGDEASAVMFSMVADLGTRRMWVAVGNPCEHEYEGIDVAELSA